MTLHGCTPSEAAQREGEARRIERDYNPLNMPYRVCMKCGRTLAAYSTAPRRMRMSSITVATTADRVFSGSDAGEEPHVTPSRASSTIRAEDRT